MADEPLTLCLIVADEIEDMPGGPRIDRFNYGFMFDYLSDDDISALISHGVSGSYGIVKKRRDGEEGKSEARFAIPYLVDGMGFASMTCPGWVGDYTDEELHEKLPDALRKIDEHIREYDARGIILATERAEAEVIKATFTELGYVVHEFERTK